MGAVDIFTVAGIVAGIVLRVLLPAGALIALGTWLERSGRLRQA